MAGLVLVTLANHKRRERSETNHSVKLIQLETPSAEVRENAYLLGLVLVIQSSQLQLIRA